MSPSNRSNSFFYLSIVSLVIALAMPIMSGCDVGTYARRLAETPKGTPPAVKSNDSSGGGESAPPEEAEPDAVGYWKLDASASVDAGSTSLKDGTVNFDFKADGSYECEVDAGDVLEDSEGRWSLSGDKISINQTHVDQEPKKASMSGEIDGNRMRINHGALTYILQRN